MLPCWDLVVDDTWSSAEVAYHHSDDDRNHFVALNIHVVVVAVVLAGPYKAVELACMKD